MAEPMTIADLMPQMMAGLGGEKRSREHIVFAAYENAVGDHLARHSRADSMRDQTLFVRVDNSALAHEITLLREPILQRMRKDLGNIVVAEIRTRVGPLT